MRLRLLVAGAAALALLATGCSSDSASSETTASEPAATQAATDEPASQPAASEPPASEAAADEPMASEPAVDSAGWATGQDVLDALEAAGIACNWTGEGEQILNLDFLTAEASDTPVVLCNGFGVQITESRDGFLQTVQATGDCAPPTEEDFNDGFVYMEFVVGDNWVVFPDGEYPAAAQPADFVDAFGGQTMTVLEVFKEACPDAVIPEPSASAQ